MYHIEVKQQTTQLPLRDAATIALDWRRCARSALRNLYTGVGPHLISEVTGRTVYFTTYESLKRYLGTRRNNDNNNGVTKFTLSDRMMAAAAWLVRWGVIYPLAENGWRAFPAVWVLRCCVRDRCMPLFYQSTTLPWPN